MKSEFFTNADIALYETFHLMSPQKGEAHYSYETRLREVRKARKASK